MAMFWTDRRSGSLAGLTSLGLATKSEAMSIRAEIEGSFHRVHSGLLNSQDTAVRAIQSAQLSLSDMQALGMAESMRNRAVVVEHINTMTKKGAKDVTLRMDSTLRELGASIRPELSAIKCEVRNLRDALQKSSEEKNEAIGENRRAPYEMDDDLLSVRILHNARLLRSNSTLPARSKTPSLAVPGSDSSLVTTSDVRLDLRVVNIFESMKLAFFALLWYLQKVSLLWPQSILLPRILRHIPRSMPNLLSNNIRFIDVLGRRHSLQFEQFRHWQVFETNLQCAFKGLPGADKVSKGDYRILNLKLQNTTLSATNWTQQILPGSSLVMSILVDSVPTWIGLCPRCDSETKTTGAAVSCPTCGLRLFQDGMVANSEDHTTPALPSVASSRVEDPIAHDSTISKEQSFLRDDPQKDEISFFQRIHLPSEIDIDEFLSRTLLRSTRSSFRVAIAGTGRVAEYIANFISSETTFPFIMLSADVSSVPCLFLVP